MCAGAKRVGKMNVFHRVPRGFGIAGGMSAIVLFIALMVGEKFPDGRLGSLSAAVMIIIPAAAGFWWSRCGASLFEKCREPQRCADNAESIFFIVCIVMAALFYNMGIF